MEARADYLTGGQALSRLLGSVVKIVSTLKNGDADLEGSGLLFTAKGQTYLVTSDHVHFQNDELAAHKIYRDGGRDPIGTCETLVSRYEYGLSLMKCDLKVQMPLLEWSQSYNDYGGSAHLGPVYVNAPWYDKDPNYLHDYRIYGLYVAGYPFASAKLLIDENGQGQLRFKDWSAILMGVNVMYEIEYIHGESGMSGGILYQRARQDDQAPTLLGLLSHKRNINSGNGKTTVFAIPAQDVNAFIRTALSNPGWRSRIRQEVRNQLRGPYDVSIGSYDFELLDEDRGGRLVRAFRLRKIGRFKDGAPYMARDFESVLDHFLPAHPDCVPFMIGSWGLMPGDKYTYGYGLKMIANPAKILESQDTRDEEALFSLKCPGTESALHKLSELGPRYQAFFDKVDPSANELLRQAAKLRSQISGADFGFGGQGIPLYAVSAKVRDVRRLLGGYSQPWAELKSRGLDTELRALLDETAAALEFVSL
jgi:hypothetical protein